MIGESGIGNIIQHKGFLILKLEGADKVSNWTRTPGVLQGTGFDYFTLRQIYGVYSVNG